MTATYQVKVLGDNVLISGDRSGLELLKAHVDRAIRAGAWAVPGEPEGTLTIRRKGPAEERA